MTPGSFASTHQSGACTGAWTLAARQAMSLRPREPGVLKVKRGKVWLTVEGPHGGTPGDSGDHVLAAGERITLAAHRHVVLEAWTDRNVCFDWAPLPQTAPAQASAQEAVVEPLRDLREAAGLAIHAFGRLAGGLARLAWTAVGGRPPAPASCTSTNG